MLRKISFLFSAVFLSILLLRIPLVFAVSSFDDVKQGDVFYMPVSYLANLGLVHGYKDGLFHPDALMNRAEALTLLFEALNPNTFAGKLTLVVLNDKNFTFADVHTTDWFYDVTKKAWGLQIIKGYKDGLFHPEWSMSRAEALKISIILESLTYTGALPVLQTPLVAPYPDIALNSWVAPYAQIAKERTLYLALRQSGNMGVNDKVSRADFAILIYRILKSRDGIRFARATWYDTGTKTASGQAFDPNKLTAAHRTLPFGTQLLVRNWSNGKSVVVTINDRGPFTTGLDLDLSRGAFQQIDDLGSGVAVIEYQEVIDKPVGFLTQSQPF